jgi:hypothetical protein
MNRLANAYQNSHKDHHALYSPLKNHFLSFFTKINLSTTMPSRSAKTTHRSQKAATKQKKLSPVQKAQALYPSAVVERVNPTEAKVAIDILKDLVTGDDFSVKRISGNIGRRAHADVVTVDYAKKGCNDHFSLCVFRDEIVAHNKTAARATAEQEKDDVFTYMYLNGDTVRLRDLC